MDRPPLPNGARLGRDPGPIRVLRASGVFGRSSTTAASTFVAIDTISVGIAAGGGRAVYVEPRAESSEVQSRTMRKVAFPLMPVLLGLYIIAYLDRLNVSFAQDRLEADLGFSGAVYGFGDPRRCVRSIQMLR